MIKDGLQFSDSYDILYKVYTGKDIKAIIINKLIHLKEF